MNNTWQRYMELATGLREVTRQRAEQVVKTLVKQGEVAADNMERLVEDLLQRSEKNRKTVSQLVKSETERAVGRLGLARQKDVERLQAKVTKLEKQLSGGATKSAPAKKSAAAKRTARKSTAKKATAPPAPAGSTPATPPPSPRA